MNIAIWMAAGALLGWAGYTYLRFNEERGMMVSVIIGAIGGLVGGKLIAPMFAAAETVPDAFSMTALVFAAVVASAGLFAGNMVYNKWGV